MTKSTESEAGTAPGSWQQLALGAVLVTMIALGLWVLQLTLEQNLQRSFLEPFDLALTDLDQRLELSAGVGEEIGDSPELNRELYRAYEIMLNLRGTADRSRDDVAVMFVNPSGTTVDVAPIGLERQSERAFAETATNSTVATHSLGDYVQRARYEGEYLSARPVHGSEGRLLGWVVGVVPEDTLLSGREQFAEVVTRHRHIVLAVSTLVIAIVMLLARRRLTAVAANTARWCTVTAVIGLTLTHLVFLALLADDYRFAVRHGAERGAGAILSQAADDLQRIGERGFALSTVHFDRLAWSRTAHQLRGFVDLRIVSDGSRLLYSAAMSAEEAASGRALTMDDKLERRLQASAAPESESGEKEGCCYTVSREIVAGSSSLELSLVLRQNLYVTGLWEIINELLSSLLVLGTFFTEALLLTLAVIATFSTRRRKPDLRSVNDGAASLMIRPLVFILLLGIDLTMSFIPLHMERIATDTFGLSLNFLVGLPISVEFLFVGVSLLVAGFWIDKRGWYVPLLAGVGLALLGSLWSWLATDPIQFIASRGVVGLGYGTAMMASQSFVVENTNDRTRAGGLANLFAGLYGGSLAGGVAGALIAEYLGFRTVFMLSAVVIALAGAYLLIIARLTGVSTHSGNAAAVAQPESTLGDVIAFLKDRRVIALVMLSSLPCSITAIGFINYFSPLYLHQFGVTQSVIGQLLMIYGLCMVFVGPLVSNRVVEANHQRSAIIAGGLVGSVAFLAFGVTDGAVAVAIAALLLGISHSLVLSSQSALLLGLPVAKKLGRAKSLGLFRSSSRIGQMLGPLAFGAAQLVGEVSVSMPMLGVAYAACVGLFVVLTLEGRMLPNLPRREAVRS